MAYAFGHVVCDQKTSIYTLTGQIAFAKWMHTAYLSTYTSTVQKFLEISGNVGMTDW